MGCNSCKLQEYTSLGEENCSRIPAVPKASHGVRSKILQSETCEPGIWTPPPPPYALRALKDLLVDVSVQQRPTVSFPANSTSVLLMQPRTPQIPPPPP